MLNLDPNLYLRMAEKDIQRDAAQRALERAARGGRRTTPGIARGGISLFTDAIRRAGAALTHLQPGSSDPASPAHRATGA